MLDECFGIVANGLEITTPAFECIGNTICFLGSPLAFPLIFCFDDNNGSDEQQQQDPPGGGWDISMLEAPTRLPLTCCFSTILAPCGQWYLRRQVLGGDLKKYKLWQGHHDGPHCMARVCPGAPITIQAGTYGEDSCPHLFLCLEVSILGGICSSCCAFNVSRRMFREERGLGEDPSEIRQNKCVAFFSELATYCTCVAGCLRCASCLAPEDMEGAQECSEEGRRASSACFAIARTCWHGIGSVKLIAMGCMSAQILHEIDHGTYNNNASPHSSGSNNNTKKSPSSIEMERE